MYKRILVHKTSLMLAACILSSCASMDTFVSAPGVSLRNVQLTDFGFSGQTFLLSFDITNPNSFPLPINKVSYGVELDGQRFASGNVECAVVIAAQGDGEIVISVELDLLRTAPQLLYIVRDGATRDIPYELKGQLGVDIPFAKPLTFKRTGEIRLSAR